MRTARQGEREIATDLPERELTRGWLKASNRALDPSDQSPGSPGTNSRAGAPTKVHRARSKNTRIEIFAMANLSAGVTGFASRSHVSISRRASLVQTMSEYIPYHVCSSRDGRAQHLSRRGPSIAPSAPDHPGGGERAQHDAHDDAWSDRTHSGSHGGAHADVLRPRQSAACPKKAVAGYFIKVEARSTDQV